MCNKQTRNTRTSTRTQSNTHANTLPLTPPPASPPSWSRFIVSCSSDQHLEDDRCRGASSRLKNIAACIIKLPELSFDRADADCADARRLSAVGFVQHVLQQQRRRLQPFQLENIRAQVMNFDGLGQQSKYNLTTTSPAYVKMLALQARRIHNLESHPLQRLNRCVCGRGVGWGLEWRSARSSTRASLCPVTLLQLGQQLQQPDGPLLVRLR